MNRRFGIALLALPLLAGVAQAGPFGPYKVDAGGNLWFRVTEQANPYGGYSSPNGAVCGPWYNYWPLDAHFQKPALGYPFWPSPQGVAKQAEAAAVPPVVAPAAPAAVKPVAYQPYYPTPGAAPVTYPSYGYPSQAPSYWYGQ
jgi:hypothetical protein